MGPNGLIAFAYPAYTEGARIWTIRSDGSGLAAVTGPGPNESDDNGHDFYDAGRMIVFSRYDSTTQRRDLYATKSDGTGAPQQITNTPEVSEVAPVVSHNGRLLAYRAFHHGTGRDSIRIVSTGNWALVREITLQPPADINISGLSFRGDDSGLYVSVQASGIPGLEYRQETGDLLDRDRRPEPAAADKQRVERHDRPLPSPRRGRAR